MSYSIEQWCKHHDISRSTYYKLKEVKKSPREMRVLGCIRISEDADREWVRAREAETAAAMEAA